MSQVANKQPGLAGTELVTVMAKEQHLDPQAYVSTVMKSCFDIKGPNNQPVAPTIEQITAFLMIAKEHKLNPITREIYAFSSRGKIQPIVSIDGWLKIINEHPDFLGMQFIDQIDDDGVLQAITCRIYRLRNGVETNHPVEVTEYLEECKMPTDPWKKWPIRMLRHKATIQCARYAFGFAGIMDPDEADRLKRVDDVVGHATVVEDQPKSAARRIVSQIAAKAEPEAVEEEIVPPAAAEEVSGDASGATGGVFDRDTDEPVGDGKAPEEEKPDLEDIPGLKKGSELSDENKAWVEDMEKEEKPEKDGKKK